MKKNLSPLMAVALAGIAAPVAQATTYLETTDYSNDSFNPTILGPFNPATDSIQGGLSFSDGFDAMQVSGTPGSNISIPFSYNGNTGGFFSFDIYDDPGFSGFVANRTYNPVSGTDTINITVPTDGDFVFFLNNESSSLMSYTIGTAVPEPGTTAMLAAAIGVAAMARRLKGK